MGLRRVWGDTITLKNNLEERIGQGEESFQDKGTACEKEGMQGDDCKRKIEHRV